MAKRERLASSGSGEEWSVIDPNEEIDLHIEEEKQSTEEVNGNNETDPSETELIDKLSVPDVPVENVPPIRWQDGVDFYKANLDNLSRIGLLIFAFFYVYTSFVDKIGFNFGTSNVVPDQPSFEKMTPNQMQRFLSEDNDVCNRLIEELKKKKSEPFLITGKEGRKMQDVRSLLNDLIVNSEKLVSALGELKLEGFTEDEKDDIKPLLLKNLKLRTDYQRRKYLEGDFENMKTSLTHWSDEYSNLRSQVIQKYTQMKNDENNQKDRNKQIGPKIDENLVQRAQEAIKKMHSEQVENVQKVSQRRSEPIAIVESKNEIEPNDSEVTVSDETRKEPKQLTDDILSEISSHKEIIQMLKELKEKYYQNKNDDKTESQKSYDKNSDAGMDGSSADLESWEEKLIEKVANAYSKFLSDNPKVVGKSKKAKIELEISDNIGKQLLKNRKNSINIKKNKEKYVKETKLYPKKKKNKQKRPIIRDDLPDEVSEVVPKSQTKSKIIDKSSERGTSISKENNHSSKSMSKHSETPAKNVSTERGSSDKKLSKEKEKFTAKQKDNRASSSYKNMNSKEKRNVFKKKFSAKKPQQIDNSVYYKGEYNKLNKKNKFCTDDDCNDDNNEDDDDDDDDVDDNNGDDQLTAPYLKRGNYPGKEQHHGLKKHWEKPELSKGFRQSSSSPKKQFISRMA